MNELICITSDERFPVSGRKLHEALAVETPYHKWFPRMCEYGFGENTDFVTTDKNVHRADGTLMPQVQRDHSLTISMAKEICMLQRTEQGRQTRRYLIAVEEQWNQPDAVIARALKMADRKIAELSGKVLELHDENETQKQVIGELKPKADYVDYILSSTGTMAPSQIAADYALSATKLNKILRDEGIQRNVNGQWILYKEHMGKGYTKSETIPITRSDGTPDTKLFTRWTQKGRLMINEVLNARGIYANMDIGQLNLYPTCSEFRGD